MSPAILSLFLSMLPSALVALLLIASVQAERNVTIDDMDPGSSTNPQSSGLFRATYVLRSSPRPWTITSMADGRHGGSIE